MAETLSPFQIEQLLILHRAGATSADTGANIFHRPALNAGAVGGALVVKGLTDSKVKLSPGGCRCRHYWLTPAGVEQAALLATEEAR